MMATHIWQELDYARRQIVRDRAGAIAALNDLFRSGVVPNPRLSGRYRGMFITPSLNSLLDSLGRAFTAWWLPWKGKTFDPATSSGDNIFTNDGLWLSHLIWPSYRDYFADGPGQSRACRFRTYVGAGTLRVDSDMNVLKIDYDLDVNPKFIIRDVLDELVQIDDGFYLGKALLRRPGNRWVCAAYFTLSSADPKGLEDL